MAGVSGRLRAEEGVTAAEYVGFGVVIAAVAVALFALDPSLAERLRSPIDDQVCDVLRADCEGERLPAGDRVAGGPGGSGSQSGGEAAAGDGAGGPKAGVTADHFVLPACLLLEASGQVGYQIKIAFVTFGEDFGFIRQVFSDGRVQLTIVDSATIGAIKSGNTRIIDMLGTGEAAGAQVEVGAGLTFGHGDTWVFDSATQEAAMLEQLDTYLRQRETYKHCHVCFVSDWLTGDLVDAPKEPSLSFSTVSVNGSLEAALGLRMPIGADEEGRTRYVNPQTGGRLEADAGYEVVVARDRDRATTSYTYTLTGSGSAGADLTVGRNQVTGTTTGSFTITRNEDGEIVAVEMISTREGGVDGSLGGSSPIDNTVDPSARVGRSETTATVTQTTLGIDNAADRAVVEEWMTTNNEQFGTPLSLTHGTLVPTRAEVGDAFHNLLHEKAQVSQIPYDNVENVRRFGLDIKAGWEFGFALNFTDDTSTARDPLYLAPPDSTGERVLVADLSCR